MRPAILDSQVKWHTFDNLQVKALKGRNMRRRIGKQADFADIQISKYLAAYANLPEHALLTIILSLRRAYPG